MTAKSFNILVLNLCVLHNYFNGPKLFFGLRSAKFLHASAKTVLSVHVKKIRYTYGIVIAIVFLACTYVYVRARVCVCA